MDGSDKYVGRILDNRYEILERVGTGGMALVYKARCHRLNRLVAIKILKEDLASDEEFRRRFHTESQAVAMLSHPNIVAVYDVSRSDNTEYIVMELIEGITLKQYINRKGLLNWKEALHFATQITKALSHAHSRGIIHRDIKPHNIMILKDGSVKVADFGIARLLSMSNTLTQEALGSVHYISPEQAKGGHIDARSDIYSVGVVMYEMLTSQLPFVGDSAVSVAIQHISAIPLLPSDINPDIPEGLENITMHAMEPELSRRYTTADEMLLDLEEFRKNPAAVFDYPYMEVYGAHNDAGVNGVALDDTQATRTVPTGAIVRAERSVPKPRREVRKPEPTRDEYRSVSRRAAKTSMLIGVFIIIVFLLVVIVFLWNYLLKDLFTPAEEEMISIPKFVGLYYDDISFDNEYIQLYEFIVSGYEQNEIYDEGMIISQDPAADREKKKPSVSDRITVTLVVSLGKEGPIHMPKLVGKLYQESKNTLINLGLDLDIKLEPVYDESVTKDYVISTIPEDGEELGKGYAVTIRYSLGPESKMVRVPLLVGHTRAELEAAFEHLLLVPTFRYFPDESEKDTVIYISHEGDDVEQNTEIVVHLSEGPPETEEPSDPSEEPTDPTEEPTDPTGEPSEPTGEPSEPTGEPTDTPAGNTDDWLWPENPDGE